jgi:hypothetical protein
MYPIAARGGGFPGIALSFKSLQFCANLRFLFAYTTEMTFAIQERKLFVVECKRCRRDVPAGVRDFPFQPIVVSCPLCGELRRYLPAEVLLGRPNHLVAKQARAQAR